MASGLRERKKQATRERISTVATGLFFSQGFDEVTVAQVAEAAGVSRMTVSNYFPRKEDLFLDLYDEAEFLLLDALQARPAGQPAVEAVRALMHRLIAEKHPLSGTLPGVEHFGRVVAASPALRHRALEQQDGLASAMASLLAEQGQDPIDADLVSSIVVATMRTLLVTAIRRRIAGESADVVTADQTRRIDRAFDLLADGLRG